MASDARPYIRVHDGMPEHPKIVGLSDPAFRLLVEAWCFCSRNKTDGKLKQAAWVKLGSAKARKELITEGLAEITATGETELHDYLEHQRSAAEIAELTERRRAAGQAGGIAKAKASATASATANGRRDAKQSAKQNASKSVAEAETTTEELEGSSSQGVSRKKRATPVPDPFPITDQLRDWAAEHAPDIRLVVQSAKLVNWAQSKSESRADWAGTWRNWMLSEQEKLDAERKKAAAQNGKLRVGNGVYDDNFDPAMQ